MNKRSLGDTSLLSSHSGAHSISVFKVISIRVNMEQDVVLSSNAERETSILYAI